MKKAIDSWIGEECIQIEETPRKSNSQKAYQLVKDLTTVKQRKAILFKIVQENASRRTRDTDPMDRILL